MKRILFLSFITVIILHCSNNTIDYKFVIKTISYLEENKKAYLAIPTTFKETNESFFVDDKQMGAFAFTNKDSTEYLFIKFFYTGEELMNTNKQGEYISNNMLSEIKAKYPKNKLKILSQKTHKAKDNVQINLEYAYVIDNDTNHYGFSSIKSWDNIMAEIYFWKKTKTDKFEEDKILKAIELIKIL